MSGDYGKKIKKAIADRTGHDTSEIKDESYFEDDLNLGDMELIELLEQLEDMFKIELVDRKDSLETVADLIDAVQEQVE